MKNWFAFLLFAGISASAGVGEKPAEIEFPLSQKRANVDLGSFLDTVSRSLFVVLRNDLSERCEIKKVASNCICTVPEFEKRTLEPGESIKIPLTVFKPFIREEEKLEVLVAFETSNEPRLLTISGFILPSLRIDRFEVEAQRLESGEVKEFPPILIESLIPSELTEIVVEDNGRRIESKVETINDAKTAIRLVLSVGKDALKEQRTFDDSVVVRFKHAGTPVNVTIDVRLSGESRVSLEPDLINVG